MVGVGIARREHFKQHGYAVVLMYVFGFASWARCSLHLAIQVPSFHVMTRIGDDTFKTIHLPNVP